MKPGPSANDRPEQTLVPQIMQYADASGCSQPGVAHVAAIIGCCDHILALVDEPFEDEDENALPRFGFPNLADAQAEATRVKAWAEAL